MCSLLYKPSQWQVARDPAEHDRRSIYLIAKRNLRLPFLETFDAPALLTSCARREVEHSRAPGAGTAQRPLSNELAAAFADRLRKETGGEPRQIVDRAYRLALGRPPTPRERGPRPGLPPRPAARTNSRWPCSISMGSSMFPEYLPSHARRRAPAVNSSATVSAVSAAWRWRRSSTRSRPAPGSPIPLAPKPPHHAAKARSVIFLFMAGGPSHLETFDPKPLLNRLHGQPRPKEFGDAKYQFVSKNAKLLGTRRTFRKYGESGIEVSDLFPHTVGMR